MELMFIVILAAALGLGVRYLLPGRERYGNAVLPAVSAAVAAAVWVGLTWLGWTFDGGWIWFVSLAAGVVASMATTLVISPRREKADNDLFQKLLRP